MRHTLLTQLAAVLSAVAVQVLSQAPFDPEEMLFIFTRCMEDNLKDGAGRLSTLSKWNEWDIDSASDPATHCFAKCILDKTGLYNPSSGKFNVDVIRTQSGKYPNLVDKSKSEALAKVIEQLPPTRNECQDVFNAYIKVHEDHKEATKNLFHGNKQLTKSIYEKLKDDIRQKGQSYFEFCENKFYPIGSKDRLKLCQIRQYVVFDDDVYKRHTECVMKGLRYLTKDNKIDREEIKRDFKEVNKGTDELEKALDGCQVHVTHKAWSLVKCLLKSAVAEDFKEASDYREVRSQNYAFNLAERKEYNKPHVSSQVMQIDDRQCPQ